MFNSFLVRDISKTVENFTQPLQNKLQKGGNSQTAAMHLPHFLSTQNFVIQIPTHVELNIIQDSNKNSSLRFSGQAGTFDLYINKYFSQSQLFLFKETKMVQNSTEQYPEVSLRFLFGHRSTHFTKKIEGFNSLHTLIRQICTGVTLGHVEYLELVGTGYRCAVTDKGIELKIGQSHPIIYKLPSGIRAFSVKPTQLGLYGIFAPQVSQTAHLIRQLKKPDSYKGKGIRLANEIITLKSGKKK